MKDTILTVLTMASVLLLGAGFAAATPRHQKTVGKSAGAYWTAGSLCLVPVSFVVNAPPGAVAFNMIVLAAALFWWAADIAWGVQKS